MGNIVQQIPRMPNNKLAILWDNAIRIQAKRGDKRSKKAVVVLDTINSEWRRRAAQHYHFPWPTTDAPGGNGRLSGNGWPEQGMLSFLGYHVGETNRTSEDKRRLILDWVFSNSLPPLENQQDNLAWDRPQTPHRLEKLANTIAALTRNAKRRDPTALRRAIHDWEGDLEYLRDRYYVNVFKFEWPTTSIW